MSAASTQKFRTAQQHAYQYLREKILSGDLAAGVRINLDAIAQALDVSRMPVRDAVRQLDSEGLVTIYPRRGVTVTSLGAEEVGELFEIRAVLEGLAARLALPHIGRDELDRLGERIERMEAAESNPVVWLRRHEEFHEYLCSLSNARRLTMLVRNQRQSIEPYVRLFLSAYRAEMPGAEHRMLFEVFKGGDPLLAETAMRDHVTSLAGFVLKFLRRVGKDGLTE